VGVRRGRVVNWKWRAEEESDRMYYDEMEGGFGGSEE